MASSFRQVSVQPHPFISLYLFNSKTVTQQFDMETLILTNLPGQNQLDSYLTSFSIKSF